MPMDRLSIKRIWTDGNVVFPCGYTIAADSDTVQLYYGAADTSIALATSSINAMLEWLEEQSGTLAIRA